jgi:primosomal protein N' (replication factor Y)
LSHARVADVVFDLPLHRSFSYAVAPGLTIQVGQRVRAELKRRLRVGVVVSVRDGDPAGLEPVREVVDGAPVFSPTLIRLAGWAADQGLSSLGSTIAALSPPPMHGAAEPIAPPPEPHPGAPGGAELWTDVARQERLADLLASAPGSALVIAPDIEASRRWAARLDAGRLDSGVAAPARRATWFAAARGRARVVVGTRSALLAPLPSPARLVLVDEHDPAHKPPGAPRLHSREVLRERARLEGAHLVLLSATPSVESWWRADGGEIARAEETSTPPWPEVVTADTRGILRNHPLTLPLTRAIEDAARRGRRAVLIVSRESTALGCDECGALFRCPDCGIALSFSRAARTLGCRLCARSEPLPARCAACGGHRLTAVGWSGERVEASVRKRFPRLAVAVVGRSPASGFDPTAQVLIGPASLLAALSPRSLGCVGFVALDALLRLPDFRAGERAFQGLWNAAEAVAADGRLVIQTLHPEHYAVRAVQTRDRAEFYSPELRFRAELGYPPYRRLCRVTVTGPSEATTRALVQDCAARLRGRPGLDVYPAIAQGVAGARRARHSFLVKGPDGLAGILREPLLPVLERRRQGAAVVEVEMDPMS